MPRPKKKVPVKVVKAVATSAPRGRKKKWEFNIVKTGNNQVNWNSGNTVGRSVRGVTPYPAGAPMIGASGEVAVTNAAQRKKEQLIEQDEVIGVVSGNTSFEASAFDVNPGLAATNPWLAQLAALYERYQYDYLVFYFKPLGSGFATNNQVGKVILCADYDAAESTPASYRQAETMDPHSDGMPFQTIELHLDPARLTREPKFTRGGPPPPATDVKTYDAANFYFCVEGTANSQNIGELRVRYGVRLMNPRLPGISAQVAQNNTTFSSSSSAAVALANGVWSSALIDTVRYNGIGATLNPGGASLQLLQGNYAITARVYFNSGAQTFSQLSILTTGEADAFDPAWGAASFTVGPLTYEVTRYVQVTGAGTTISVRAYSSFPSGGCGVTAYLLVRTC